ncbi:hypothetical protein BX600DRAFT_103184 [Xylariales sp. PMI_506]|nr:hypothetical protein BX600DRAFT_103184 [Xylariales sp. PMI_506]
MSLPPAATMSQRAGRPFSTASGVHPAYLPSLHRASRVEKKLVPAAVATVGIGLSYGIARYRQTHGDSDYSSSAAETAAAVAAAQRRLEEARMMDAYGDRSSLADMDAAIKAYEQQQQRSQR